MHVDTSFHQMLTADNGNFVFSPLDGSILTKINCRQNSCNLELNNLFNKIAAMEISILENFKTLAQMVKEAPHFDIQTESTDISLPTSDLDPPISNTNLIFFG